MGRCRLLETVWNRWSYLVLKTSMKLCREEFSFRVWIAEEGFYMLCISILEGNVFGYEHMEVELTYIKDKLR